MTALLLAVFVASLLGSLHCAGMCGPLMACAVSVTGRETVALGPGFDGGHRWGQWARHAWLQVGYHVGRLVGYALLGGVAGGVGALLDLGSTLSGLQPVAAVLAGGVMVVIGLAALCRVSGWLDRWMNAAAGLGSLGRWAQGVALRVNAGPRAWGIGLLTPLLPCGWLYAFVLTAAGTGGVWSGAAVMGVFWLGTLPVLVGLGLGLQGAFGLAGWKLPWVQQVAAVAVIALGLFTLSGRVSLDAEALAGTVETREAARHASMGGGAGGGGAGQGVGVPDAGELPACCAERLKGVSSEAGDEH